MRFKGKDYELAPCPFCGKAEFDMLGPTGVMEHGEFDGSETICYIQCEFCYSRGPAWDIMDSAVSEWNRRADAGA